MNRPTITLACIMKDEINHIKEMLRSVHGCFDEVHLTDTGSTDGTLEFARSQIASDLAGCPVKVLEFTWIDDFAAARNHSMSEVKTDFVMWMDLDDRMSDVDSFKQWRDHVMLLADFWLAPYHYAKNDKGDPVCTFIRERVIRTKKKFSWKYFIHEGMIADEHVEASFVNSWWIVHERTKEDYEKDYLRNVSILEKRAKKEELPTRLKWYHGKELFDKQKWAEAYVWLDQVVDRPELELHDRILCFEYLVRSSIQRFHNEESHKAQKNYSLLVKALSLCMQATILAPHRAEFWCLAGDCYVLMSRPNDALPMFGAAIKCQRPGANDASFIFANADAYEYVPRNQIARIQFQQGDLNGAILTAKESLMRYPHPETEELIKQFTEMKLKIKEIEGGDKVDTDEVVFSCIPGSHPYEFDGEVYRQKGIGGSETALVEVAEWMTKLTHRKIIVFNTREQAKNINGVEYRPAQQMHDYFKVFKPGVHIAWRHNVKLTDAPTYLWCHDLYTPGGEVHKNYVKHLCLSDFHKNYVQVQQKIPTEKIHITRNGVDINRFNGFVAKNENKIVFPSSPDRGLDRAILIIEEARKTKPDLELHAYYGLDNMKKMGGKFGEMAVRLEEMMKSRPWVKYHGNVDQKTLAREMKEAVVWLYPANFIESFCITAIESVFAQCFGLVREIGALKNTVKPFHDKGWAKLLYLNAETDEERAIWAKELIEVLDRKPWLQINPKEFDYSWKGVALDFMNLMGIEKKELDYSHVHDAHVSP
jgi:glycosyltransferase involved in cell wall biosynthesis